MLDGNIHSLNVNCSTDAPRCPSVLKRTWRNWKDAKALEEREQLMISAKWLGCCADEELFSIARNLLGL